MVAGPTASGKSALALALAEEFGGVIINADALQVYRDLRVLTARPDPAAEARAPHRLYGYRDAAERGSAARWRADALAEIAAASAAGHLPILVGGTGLYIKALRDGLAPVPEIPAEIRAEAASLHRAQGGTGLRDRLAALDPAGAARLHSGDTQRLIRAWEVVRATGLPLARWQERAAAAPAPFRFGTILLMPERAALYRACDARLEAMIAGGALDEVRALARRGLDPDLPAMKAVGLRELLRHVEGDAGLAEAGEAARRATRRYAKRQTTWFRHQLRADLVGEQFSESLLRCSRQFIRGFLLTPPG